MALDTIAVARAEIAQIYIAAFNRVPDAAGLSNWLNQYTAGLMTYAQIAEDFTRQAEYQAKYPSIMTNTEYVTEIYQNVFGRTPDAGGLANWTNQLDHTSITGINRGNIMKLMLDAAGATGNTDGVRLDNQASFAVQSILDGVDTDAATAQLVNITSDTATVTTATAAVSASANLGQTFTLTTGADNFTGTANNDTFNGFIDATASAPQTLTSADTINGGAGTDTLSIIMSGTGAGLGAPSLTSIETINVRAVGVNMTSTDMSIFSGVTAFNTDRSTGTTAVTNMATGSSVGMIGDGTAVNATLSYAYATASAAQTINISGGTVNTGTANITNTSGAGVTTATINSTNGTNAVDTIKLDSTGGSTVTSLTVNATTALTATLTATDFAATSALTVTGAGAVNLGTAANFKTIDASASSGGLTIAGGTNTTAFTGSTGNDVFTTAVYTTPTAGMINGGSGTDTLVLSSTTVMDTAAEAAYYTGFETLRVAGSQDLSLLSGITALEINSATGSYTNLNATQAAAVKVMGAETSATIALADSSGTSDVLSLTMGTGLTTSAATGFSGALTVNGFETLNIATNAGPSATAGANQTTTIGSFAADKLTAINLTGQSVTLSNAATTKATTINASALTGNGTTGLTLAGTLVAGSTVTGSGVADAITLGTAGSTYNLGAGNDTVSGTLAQYRTTTTYNTIDAGTGTDTLTISDGAATTLTMVDDDFKGMTNVEAITITDTTSGNQTITTGGWFDANFKAAGATLTTTTTTGSVTLAAGTFSGNMTVNSTSGAITGGVSITTGSGNDTVTVTATSITTSSSISTGAGNDTIVGSAAAETITGGTGSDTMTGSGAVDIFVFGSNGSVYGTAMDIITDFNTLGADVLSFTTATLLAADATAAVAGSNVQQSAGGLITFATADNTLALKVAAIQADAQLDAADSVAMFVDGANTYVYYAGTSTGNSDDQIIQLSGITSLATITDGGTTITIA